jgi:hypothetical protein
MLLELLGGAGGSPDDIVLHAQQAQHAPASAQLPVSGFGAPTGALTLAHDAQIAALRALLRMLHCVPAGGWGVGCCTASLAGQWGAHAT